MLRRLPLDRIQPNPDQPRKRFDEKELGELALSIKHNGLIQPIMVRSAGDGTYQIVAGERRWRAHCLLREWGEAVADILTHIRNVDEDTRDIHAIIENMQRADITPLEEARAFQRMLDKEWSVEQLARSLGLQQTWRITYRTRLLALRPEYQHLLDKKQISLNAASEIAKLEPADQDRVVRHIRCGELKGDTQVNAAVDTILNTHKQPDIFGKPEISEKEVEQLSEMERRIQVVEKMVSAGWKDGECITAFKVDPNRAKSMA